MREIIKFDEKYEIKSNISLIEAMFKCKANSNYAFTCDGYNFYKNDGKLKHFTIGKKLKNPYIPVIAITENVWNVYEIKIMYKCDICGYENSSQGEIEICEQRHFNENNSKLTMLYKKTHTAPFAMKMETPVSVLFFKKCSQFDIDWSDNDEK